jgi:hypothetical protein
VEGGRVGVYRIVKNKKKLKKKKRGRVGKTEPPV